MLCENMGRLVDVYLAGRRDSSGSFFSFVKFDDEKNTKAIEIALNATKQRRRKFYVNLAKHPRKKGHVGVGGVRRPSDCRAKPLSCDIMQPEKLGI
ncbi:unnamed protein product [Lactuca virosa]|uniref:RRM domain-containing protein n=1 Tax=Lactuca virosa TaxID=75947 RepID=A0AAU9P250_9ASTR|nr:unnamed protein product [Lactuca virosa]